MSRSARIRKVLEERRPLSERVKLVDKSVSILSLQLRTIKSECRRAKTLEAVRRKSTLDEIERKCDVLLETLDKFRERVKPLLSRLDRHTINIGVIGPIGAGKSSLLQAITGLNGSVIPAASGTGSFTSTKSIIRHSEQVEEAHVEFYSENELIAEVLRPYLLKLGLTDEHKEVVSLDEFLEMPLPEDAPDENRTALLELKKYQSSEHLEKYRPYLNHDSKRLDDLEEVTQFLTYWDPGKLSSKAQSSSKKDKPKEQSLWMATRQVTINCRFDAEDVGEVALIDMPGFGDTQAGNEERLVRALENDVDLTLYIYRPAPARDGWQKSGAPEHFRVAKQALNGQLPLKEWSFVVLNHMRSTDSKIDTYEICKEMAEKMYENGIDATSALICDVKQSRDVRERILDPILNYLSDNIARMDYHFAQEIQREALALQATLSQDVEELRSLCNLAFEDTDEAELLALKSTELWEQLKEALVSKLYHKVWPARDRDDEKFIKLVKTCIDKASASKTDPTTLRRIALDGSTVEAAMRLLHDIRIDVVSSLQPVYRSPFEAVENLKKEVTDILCTIGGFERINRIGSATDKLAEISAVLRRLKGCRRLAEAVDLVREFDTSSGVLLPEIRSHLTKLDPEFATTEDHKSLNVEGDPVAEDKLKKTVEALDKLKKEVVDAIGKSLIDKQKVPSQTAAFLLFEFVDRTVRDNSAINEWRKVHNQLRQELWPQDFTGLAEAKEVEQSIESALETLEYESEPSHFRFAIA